jgi:hypothetical protein
MRYLRYDTKREKIWYELIKLENRFLKKRDSYSEHLLTCKLRQYSKICWIIQNGF